MYISFMVISENFSQSSLIVGNFAFPFLISFLGELSELFFFFFFVNTLEVVPVQLQHVFFVSLQA